MATIVNRTKKQISLSELNSVMNLGGAQPQGSMRYVMLKHLREEGLQKLLAL